MYHLSMSFNLIQWLTENCLQISKRLVFWCMKLSFRTVRFSKLIVCVANARVLHVGLYIGCLEYVIPTLEMKKTMILCSCTTCAKRLSTWIPTSTMSFLFVKIWCIFTCYDVFSSFFFRFYRFIQVFFFNKVKYSKLRCSILK